jgi:hypothetical protein
LLCGIKALKVSTASGKTAVASQGGGIHPEKRIIKGRPLG